MKQPTKPCSKCGGSGRIPDSAALGLSLRKRREAMGLSIRRVAARMRISPMYLSDLERGARAFRKELIESYEEALER